MKRAHYRPPLPAWKFKEVLPAWKFKEVTRLHSYSYRNPREGYGGASVRRT